MLLKLPGVVFYTLPLFTLPYEHACKIKRVCASIYHLSMKQELKLIQSYDIEHQLSWLQAHGVCFPVINVHYYFVNAAKRN